MPPEECRRRDSTALGSSWGAKLSAPTVVPNGVRSDVRTSAEPLGLPKPEDLLYSWPPARALRVPSEVEGSLPLHMRPHPGGKASFVHGSRGQPQDRLRRVFFSRRKPIAVHFEKKDPNEESGALVAIDERVGTDDPAKVG